MRHSRHCGPRHGGPAQFDPREDWSMHGHRGDYRRGGPPGFGPRGRRARRGAVKAAVLVLLDEEPRNGYALIQEIEARSEGAWRPSPGSIYPALAMMEDEGLIRSVDSDDQRAYELTDKGREQLAQRGEDAPAPWEPARSDDGPTTRWSCSGRCARSTWRRVRSPRPAPPSRSSRPSRPWPRPGGPCTGCWPRIPRPSERSPARASRARGFCCTFTRCREDGSDRRCRRRGRDHTASAHSGRGPGAEHDAHRVPGHLPGAAQRQHRHAAPERRRLPDHRGQPGPPVVRQGRAGPGRSSSRTTTASCAGRGP